MDTHWIRNARCLDSDPEAFFATDSDTVKGIKKMCARCPVRTPCLEESVRTLASHGVWGGQDEDERRPLLQAERARRRELVA